MKWIRVFYFLFLLFPLCLEAGETDSFSEEVGFRVKKQSCKKSRAMHGLRNQAHFSLIDQLSDDKEGGDELCDIPGEVFDRQFRFYSFREAKPNSKSKSEVHHLLHLPCRLCVFRI